MHKRHDGNVSVKQLLLGLIRIVLLVAFWLAISELSQFLVWTWISGKVQQIKITQVEQIMRKETRVPVLEAPVISSYLGEQTVTETVG